MLVDVIPKEISQIKLFDKITIQTMQPFQIVVLFVYEIATYPLNIM